MRMRGNLTAMVGGVALVVGAAAAAGMGVGMGTGCSTARLADTSPPPGDGVVPADGAGVDTEPDAGGPGFTEAPPSEPDGPLCDIPPDYIANGGDPYRPPCAIAVGVYRDPAAVPKSVLHVVAWNVEFGKDSATVAASLAGRAALANADVLLLSEVPRASLTSNPQNINFARDLAMRFHMSYAFAVEWDRRDKPDELGEHGVAVLSRYPIGNPRMLRHAQLNDWYASDQLYGGRVSLGVDVLVGGRVLALYASHFDTRGTGDGGRAMQAAELRADAEAAGRPATVVDGGDFNTWTCNPLVSDCTVAPAAEQTIEDFLADGWTNGDGAWNGVTQLGKGFFPQRLDWLFFRGPAGAVSATFGQADDGATGSDHLPVYFDLRLQ